MYRRPVSGSKGGPWEVGALLWVRYPCKVFKAEDFTADHRLSSNDRLQGYLAHKKTPTPLGPP